MAIGLHKCYVASCEEQVTLDRGMCFLHYRSLPTNIKKQIETTTGIERTKAWAEAKRIVNERIDK